MPEFDLLFHKLEELWQKSCGLALLFRLANTKN